MFAETMVYVCCFEIGFLKAMLARLSADLKICPAVVECCWRRKAGMRAKNPISSNTIQDTARGMRES